LRARAVSKGNSVLEVERSLHTAEDALQGVARGNQEHTARDGGQRWKLTKRDNSFEPLRIGLQRDEASDL
jgi:hypothetical protein